MRPKQNGCVENGSVYTQEEEDPLQSFFPFVPSSFTLLIFFFTPSCPRAMRSDLGPDNISWVTVGAWKASNIERGRDALYCAQSIKSFLFVDLVLQNPCLGSPPSSETTLPPPSDTRDENASFEDPSKQRRWERGNKTECPFSGGHVHKTC